MSDAPRICVVIPVYNHALTVRQVVHGARAVLPVIVVDDGSTDATPAVLAKEQGGGSDGRASSGKTLSVVTLPGNQGKAAALQAGFAHARALGFTHAITLDADGQHSTATLPVFVAACRRQPEALILGVRDFRKVGAPFARRASNALSTFWFKFETGVRLADTQCGYRCYPLALLRTLRASSGRYAYELEIIVKAAWAGLALVPQAVEADYAAPTSRLSHFRPWRDMAAISWLHSKLSIRAFFVPAVLRRLAVQGLLRGMQPGERWRTVLRHLFSEHTETPGRLAAAVGLGLFCGIAPIWGFQMVAAAALAHKFRLNKAIALTASNVSFAPVAPIILAAGLVVGHFLWTGQFVEFAPKAAARQIPAYVCQWAVGSLVLAAVVGMIGAGVAFVLARLTARGPSNRRLS
jgi:uncharacterized protein (DUF2062 family)